MARSFSPTRSGRPAPPPRPAGANRRLALAVLCSGQLMVVLDSAVVSVALPRIQDDLDFSQPGLAWVVNAYLVAFGGVLLLAGRLGDLIGRKRVFVAGLLAFTAASLLCGLAGSQAVLVAARFLQGLGGAMATAVVLGMIVVLYPEPRERARAIAVTGFVAAAGASIGVIAGGALTQVAGWHWIFLVNLPIGVAAVALAARVVAADRGMGLRAGADGLGAVLVTAGLMLGVVAIVGVADHGWAAARTRWLGALSVALLVGFVARQARAASPLLPPRLFRSRALTGANLVQALMVAGMSAPQFVGVLYLQLVLGYGALATSLAILPVALVLGAVSLGGSARLITRFGARAVLLPGLALIAAALALLARAPVDGRYPVDVLPAMLLLGAGAGLSMPALMTLAMSGVPQADAGAASGLVTTTAQVGSALGLAVLATLATSRSQDLLAGGQPVTHALAGGYRFGFAVAAGLAVAALALAATLPRTTARAGRGRAGPGGSGGLGGDHRGAGGGLGQEALGRVEHGDDLTPEPGVARM